MAEPSWQETIRIRLVERNAKQTAFASIIEQCRPSPDQHWTTSHVGSVRPNPSSSTVYIPGTAGPGEDNPVRAAYITSLESQISSLRDELASDQHNEIMAEKDRTAQLGQIEERNQVLVKDNAKLLQRWLDDKQAQANRMNEANDFYEDMRSRHQAVINWQGEAQPQNAPAGTASGTTMTSQTGNGVREGEGKMVTTTTGQRSPPETQQDQSPNG
ncbi:ATG16-domain-containing protein [Pisolithus croceorrhizus]|nr:ATG16-domain-containing protein [Pisolithus croceorrhizus]